MLKPLSALISAGRYVMRRRLIHCCLLGADLLVDFVLATVLDVVLGKVLDIVIGVGNDVVKSLV